MTETSTPTPESVRFVQIEPTTRCNYICGFCSGRHMDQSDLTLGAFEEMLAAFPGIRHMELQGEGEPLLHKDFFAMARLARDRGIMVSMITNGSLLTPDAVANIVDCGIAAVRVSIESADPAAFQKIRGGKLEKVCEGIERLIAARTTGSGQKPTVGFMITVLRDTVDCLPGIADLHDRLGMDGGICVQPLNRMDAYQSVYDEEMADQFIDREAGDRVRALIESSPRIQALMRDGDAAGHFYTELSRANPAPHGCPWVRGALYVNRHGHVTTCCMVKDTDRFGLGKIGETPTMKILETRTAIDRHLTAGRIPAQCAGCGYIAQMAAQRQATGTKDA